MDNTEEKPKLKEFIDQNSSYEKLRDELFHYRIEIQSYKRSMGMLAVCVSIVLAVIGFFGYNKVDSIVEEVKRSANERLSRSDSILAKIDTRFLDSITTVVQERTVLYEKAVDALEKGTRVNNELFRKLIAGLPYNKRAVAKTTKHYLSDATNLFDVVYYTDSYKSNEEGVCYIVMGDEYKQESDDVFLVEILPENRNVAVFYQTFEVQRNYNKLHFSFSQFETYKDYQLKVVLLRNQGDKAAGYGIIRKITIK
jgi:hypothetical protein